VDRGSHAENFFIIRRAFFLFTCTAFSGSSLLRVAFFLITIYRVTGFMDECLQWHDYDKIELADKFNSPFELEASR
jgi:hypothetical protein